MSNKLANKLLPMFGAALLVASLAACGGSNGESSGTQKSENTIELLTFFEPEGTSGREEGLKQVVDAFTEKTGIEVEYTVLPWDKLESQLLLSVRSGKSPDVSFVRDRSFDQLLAADALTSLQSRIDGDLEEDYMDDFLTLDATSANDEVYAFPISFIGTALYLRQDLLSDAGQEAPATWEEFVDVGQALNSGSTAGFLFNGSQTQPNQLDFLQSMIEGRGGEVLDDEGRAVFDSEAGIEAFQFLKDSVYQYEITPANVSTLNYDQANDAFSAGRGGMTITGSHRYSTVSESLGAENLTISRIPGVTSESSSPTVVSSWSLGIPQDADNADEAWQFIEFASSPEQVLNYSKASGEVPSKASVLNDDYFSDQEVTRFFADYITDHSSPAVVGPANAQLNDIVARTVQQLVGNPDSDVQKLVEGAVEEYNALLK